MSITEVGGVDTCLAEVRPACGKASTPLQGGDGKLSASTWPQFPDGVVSLPYYTGQLTSRLDPFLKLSLGVPELSNVYGVF